MLSLWCLHREGWEKKNQKVNVRNVSEVKCKSFFFFLKLNKIFWGRNISTITRPLLQEELLFHRLKKRTWVIYSFNKSLKMKWLLWNRKLCRYRFRTGDASLSSGGAAETEEQWGAVPPPRWREETSGRILCTVMETFPFFMERLCKN